MKKIYEAPVSELIYLTTADIITASPADSRVDDFEDDIIIAYENRRGGYYYYLCPAFYYEFKGFVGDYLILTHTPTGRDEYINKPVWWADANVMGNFFNDNAESKYGR